MSDLKSTAKDNVKTAQKNLDAANATLAAATSDVDKAAAASGVVAAQQALTNSQNWEDTVSKASQGELLFDVNCARCHTKGASYYDPNNLALPKPPPNGSGAFGPNLTGGSTLRQFPGVAAGEQQQFDWVAVGRPANEGYGVRGISSGRMPYFVNMLSEKQIKAIVAYERSL